MSSTSPLIGKLAQLFSPRLCLFVSTIILAVGVLVASAANGFPVFIVGRIITGVGAGGIFTISVIVVLELTGPKRRGIMIGLLNSGYTVGVALGATAAGALLSKVGWRALFWMQAPISIMAGTILLFAIPHDFTAGKKNDPSHSILRRLSTIDYFGAVTLVISHGLVTAHVDADDIHRQLESCSLYSLSRLRRAFLYCLCYYPSLC